MTLSSLESIGRLMQAKGRKGAFSCPERNAFLKQLVVRVVPLGIVEIVRVRPGDGILGIFFCLVKNDTVYYLQSGFNYELEPGRQPGYGTHSHIVQWHTDRGMRRFDLLSGGAYKGTLAEHTYMLIWSSTRKKRVKFTIIESLHSAKTGAGISRVNNQANLLFIDQWTNSK